MKKNKKDLKKHGVISIVQSPDEENIKFEKKHKTDIEKKADNSEGHGIISTVQAPDDAVHT